MKGDVTVAPLRYDPRPVLALVARLERKAAALTRGGPVVGSLFGAALGAIPLTPLDSIWRIPSAFAVATLMCGGLFGGLIGFVIGRDRGVAYRGRAQLMLCQLRTEQQASAAAQALAKLGAPPAPQRAGRRGNGAAVPLATPPVSAR